MIVNEIISSSGWFRTPLSRTAAYTVDLSKELKSVTTVDRTSPNLPTSKWYHHILNKSRGQVIGATVGAGFLGWFMYDLVTKWGEGGFWKRTGLLTLSLIGDMFSFKTRPQENLFSADLIASGLIKFAESYDDEDKVALVEQNLRGTGREIRALCNAMLQDSTKRLGYLTRLALHLNKTLKPLGISTEFKYNKKQKVECFFYLNESFEHNKSNAGVNYTPFVTILDLTPGNLVMLIEEYMQSGKRPKPNFWDVLLILAFAKTNTGYYLKTNDNEIKIQNQQSISDLLNDSLKTIVKRLQKGKPEVTALETDEAPCEKKNKFNVVG